MLIYVILIFLLFFGYNISIYKNSEESDLVKVFGYGNAKISYGLSKAHFKYDINLSDFDCDPGTIYPSTHCDIKVTFFIAIYGDYRRSSERNTFHFYQKVFKDWSANPTGPNYKKELNDVNIDTLVSSWNAPDNTNQFRGSIFSFTTSNYLRIIDFCAFIVDRNTFEIEKFLIHYCNHIYINRNKVQKKFHNKNLATISEVWSTIEVECSENYYQPTCWYKCVPVKDKYDCDESGQKCLNYWQPSLITYQYDLPTDYFNEWKQENVTILKCIFYNVCLNVTEDNPSKCHEPNHLCYPMNNSSFTCLKFDPKYELSTHDVTQFNYTFNTLVYPEYLVGTFSLLGTNAKHLLSSINCFWNIPSENPPKELYLRIEANVIYTKRNIKFTSFSLNYICNVGTIRRFVYYHHFQIYALPENIFLKNMNSNSIYIGQILECSSDGEPSNRTKHILYLESNNAYNKDRRKNKAILVIPMTVNNGPCFLVCVFILTFPDGRKPVEVIKRWQFFLESYVKLNFQNIYKNVYYVYEFTSCNYTSFIKGYLGYDMISSNEKIVTATDTKYNIKTFTDSSFAIVCESTKKRYKRSSNRRLVWEKLCPPNTTCLQLHYATLGSFLRCGCNAYPPDLVSYNVMLIIYNRIIMYSNIYSIQIPYFLIKNKFEYICNVTFLDNVKNTSMEIRKHIIINYEPSAVVTFTYKDYLCSKYYVKSPILNALQISETEVLFISEMFLLNLVPSVLLSIFFILLSLLILLSVTCCLVLNAGFRIQQKKHYMKKRRINDRLLAYTSLLMKFHSYNTGISIISAKPSDSSSDSLNIDEDDAYNFGSKDRKSKRSSTKELKNDRKSIKNLKNDRKSMKENRKSMKENKNDRKSMKENKNDRKSIKENKNDRKSIKENKNDKKPEVKQK